MSVTSYLCKNFGGGCSKALEHEIIEIEPGDELRCPECRETVFPVKLPGKWWERLPKGLVPALALVLVAVSSFALWAHLKGKRTIPAAQKGGQGSTSSYKAVPTPPPVCDDARLAGAIRTRIAVDEDLKGDHILVDVSNHVVILSGTVSSESDRTRVKSLVQFVDVPNCSERSVNDDLSAAPSDQAIDKEARRRLAADTELRLQPIRIGVTGGVLVLSGSVSQRAMRSNAGTLMDGIAGLHNVINNIDFIPPPPPPVHTASSSSSSPPPPPPPPPPPIRHTLAGSWSGTYMSCSQATTPAWATIQDNGDADILTALHVQIPASPPGSVVMHGGFTPLSGYLTLMFNGWEHQPAGISMGNIGGYVRFTRDGADASFTGTIHSPGCGTLTLQRH